MSFTHKLSSRLARLWSVRVLAAAFGSLAITLGCTTVAPTDAGPISRLVIVPPVESLAVNQTASFAAVGLSSSNDTVPVSVTWSSSNTSVASIDANGLATALAAGSTTITATSEGKSGTATFTVTGGQPPRNSACLSQAGPLVSLNGFRTSTYETASLAASTKVDARTAQFLVDQSVDVPVRVAGGLGICWSGGEILGQYAPATPWATMHDKYGMIPGSYGSANGVHIENLTVFSYGDGISFDEQPDSGWSIRNVHIKYSRDDCVENDFLNAGTIDSTFLDGCYTTLSSQPYTGNPDGTNNVITISNSLFRLQSMDGVYSGALPNHNAFWKWNSNAPSLALYNNVFRADGPSQEGPSPSREYMTPPPGKLADCRNNVMVWLGAGAYPETLPTTFNGQPCFTIMTGTAGLQYWNNAVAKWQAAHPDRLPDVAPPIVSLFSPGVSGSSSLTGTVTLTATAVDDRAVTSVQFQLNGQNIGAPVTQDGVGDGANGSTKYWISWDSRSMANGTYTLTAIAKDAAGHATTSAGVSVTVSN